MDESQNLESQEVVYQEPSSSPIKKIISLAIGAAVILGLIAVVIFFVLPLFRSQEPDEATLIYWGIWEDRATFDEITAEFTRQNPNIKIQYEKQDPKGLGKYIDRLATRIQDGNGPDIYRYHNSWLTQLKPFLLPLPKSVVEATELESSFYPVVASDLKVEGAYYGVPIHFDTLALFVNTELFQNAGIETPTNWEDLIDVAKQLTVKDEEGNIITSGIALGTYDNIAHAPDIISLLLIQNGADILDLNGESGENALEALQYYTLFARGESKVWDENQENSKLAFAKGDLAIYFGYSWDIFEIKAINPDLEFSVNSVPSLTQADSTIASYWVEGVSSKTKAPNSAFKFLEYLGKREVMQKLYEKGSQTRLFGSLYPRSDMAQLLSDNNLIYPFVSQGGSAKSTIFSSDTYDEGMIDELNSYMGNAIRSILFDNTSIETAIETLANGVTQVLSRYVQSN